MREINEAKMFVRHLLEFPNYIVADTATCF